MRFQRTAVSVFQSVSTMQIEREQEIANLLQTYEKQQESANCPDRTLLYQAKALLEARRVQVPLDRELVELGHTVYRSLGQWSQEIALLQQFLTLPSLSNDEQAWGCWQRIDCLALAGKDDEVVEEQHAFFLWAIHTFPLEDCFFVIADGTQARSWLKSGCGSDWLCLQEQLFALALATAENRLDRFYCLRTGVHLCLALGEITRARYLVHRLHLLGQEDPTWSERRWISIEIAILEMALAETCGERAQVRHLAEMTTITMKEWERHLNMDISAEIGRFRSLCQNIAAPLYRAKQYDLAIPLLQKAVDYYTNPYYAYLWLAGAIWQTTHQREKVFPLLQQAAARYDGEGKPWETFRMIPEFADVPYDSGFLAVTDIEEEMCSDGI